MISNNNIMNQEDAKVINWLIELKNKISYGLRIFNNYNIMFDNVINELKIEKHICGHIKCKTCDIFVAYNKYCECYIKKCPLCKVPCRYEEIKHDRCYDCWDEFYNS